MKVNANTVLVLLFVISALFLFHANIFSEEKPVTRINIENDSGKIIISVAGCSGLTWLIEHKESKKPALVLNIFPVSSDSFKTREYPINSGLVRNIVVEPSEKKENTLSITINVVTIPRYRVNESKDKHEIIMSVEREIFKGKRKTLTPEENLEVIKIENENKRKMRRSASLLGNITVLIDATKKDPVEASFIPVETVVVAEEKKNLKESISLLKVATGSMLDDAVKQNEKKPKPQKKEVIKPDKSRNTKQKSGKETGNLINREFTKTDIVVILKYLANLLNLDLVSSPQVKGAKSIELTDMTAEEAIPLILKGTNYKYKIAQNILFVGPPEILDTLTPEEMMGETNEIVTKIFVLKKIRIEDIVPELSKDFPDVKFVTYTNLNAIEVTARNSLMKRIEAIVEVSDREKKPERVIRKNEFR